MVTEVSALEVMEAPAIGTTLRAGAWVQRAIRSEGPIRRVVRFSWHFLQMAIAMQIGMVVGMAPPVLSVLGLAHGGAPEAYALEMTVAMVIPMATWMLIRRHGWERTAEMSGAMSVPVLLLAAGSLVGLLPHSAALVGMNVLMWVGMLGAMLFRWREYAQHGHGAHGAK